MISDERDYDGTGTGHEAYGEPAYRGRGQAGDEVADALTAELAAEFGSDDPAASFAPHSPTVVGRLTEDTDALISEHDDVTAHYTGDDDDLSAEEAALHYVDPENDPIPE